VPAPRPPPLSLPRPTPIERVQNFWQRVSEGRRRRRSIGPSCRRRALHLPASRQGRRVEPKSASSPAGSGPWPVISRFSGRSEQAYPRAPRSSPRRVRPASFSSEKPHYEFLAALLFLFLLALELADKVIMKRDLGLPAKIQSWLVAFGSPPAIPGRRSRLLDPPQIPSQ